MLNTPSYLKKRSIVFGFLFMVMLMFVGCSGEASKKEAELRKNIQIMVDELQQHLPMQFGEDVIWNKAEADGSRLVYTYSLNSVSIKKQKLNDSKIKEMKNVSYEMVKAGVCTNTDTKAILIADGGFEYIYNDVDGKEIMKFVITENDCK